MTICYNISMAEETDKQYIYKKWPLFTIVYSFFAILYFSFVFSFAKFFYKDIIETLVMTIFVVSSPLLVYFYLKIVKIKKYQVLSLQLLYSWLISTLVIFLLQLTYVKGWDWFGVIALLLFLLFYHVFWFIFSYILFRVKKPKVHNN